MYLQSLLYCKLTSQKGALFLLGHVIVTPDFSNAVPEARRQQTAWTKYIDVSKVKAFVNIAISPTVEWGTRNIVLSAGLGKPRTSRRHIKPAKLKVR